MLPSHDLQLMNNALWLVLTLSAPPIVAASVAGLLVAILQSATQLQEQTLQYAVKFLTIVIVLFVTGGALGGALFAFSDRIFSNLPALLRQ